MEEDGFQLVYSRRRGRIQIKNKDPKWTQDRWKHDAVIHAAQCDDTPTTKADQKKMVKKIQTMTEEFRTGDYTNYVLPYLTKAIENSIGSKSNTIKGIIKSIICYGLGNFSYRQCSANQLAFLLCMKDDLLEPFDNKCGDNVQLFDPVFTKIEKTVMVEDLGLQVIEVDERCSRKADELTCFLMPHLDTVFYDNLLAANESQLENLILIGNSLSDIASSIVYTRGYFERTFVHIAKCLNIVTEYPLRIDRAYEKGFSNTSIHTFNN